MRLVHTCIRVRDVDASLRFYEALGFERRGQLNFESAYNVYLGLPGGGDTLELTVNVGRTEPYDLGEGYNHVAVTVDDLDAVLRRLEEGGVTVVPVDIGEFFGKGGGGPKCMVFNLGRVDPGEVSATEEQRRFRARHKVSGA